MDMNRIISDVLRTGVVMSALLIALGAAVMFSEGGSNGYPLSTLASADAAINSSMFPLPYVISSALAFQGAGIIMLGLMVLVATPVVRVLLSVFAFSYERNWLYAAITAIVFIDLMVALLVVPGLAAR